MKPLIAAIVLVFCLPLVSSASGPEGLEASGPLPEQREKLMLFGQFVGQWEFDWHVVWIGPQNNKLRTLIARKVGDEIILEMECGKESEREQFEEMQTDRYTRRRAGK